MRIAIVGGGISGLTCAWLLHRAHEITVFEAGGHIGGHANTVTVREADRDVSIDTGFIVFNDRNYPRFQQLLRVLNVEQLATSMSFSVRSQARNLEYSGSGLRGVFAQRRNLLRPAFLRMVRHILKFNRLGTQDVGLVDPRLTVAEYLRLHHLSDDFRDLYLLPMGASIWSCPTGTFAEFPVRFILEFFANHGLLSLHDRPTWFTIPGGSANYVRRLVQPFQDRVRMQSPVKQIVRSADCVRIMTDRAEVEFDEVILACHADQGLRLLAEPTPMEQETLSQFPYGTNEVVLHTDESVLPRRRSVWSAWNFLADSGDEVPPLVTYNMNILQHLQSDKTYCVSLNCADRLQPSAILSRHRYAHPVFSVTRATAQQKHRQLIRAHRTSWCGAYWGNGFHEDGVVSALAVCRKFGSDNLAEPAGSERGVSLA